ncbi:hypothetical protein N8Z47_00205 [Salibacteraceae bacterium]|jgi:outer membrane lipoprotein-sorting protein|nr:hypothetical protein [Salibacteraceae bacterium]
MRKAKLYKMLSAITVLSLAFLLLASAAPLQSSLQKLSFDVTIRTLFNGKSVTATGSVYYVPTSGLMVTKMHSPMNQVVISTSDGQMKNYDPSSNKVIFSQGSEFSSKNSFIYSFLSGNTTDMGLSSDGYKIIDTKNDDGTIVNTWSAPTDRNVEADKVEIAFKDYLPIYMGFMNAGGEIIQKTYYSNYQNLSYIRMPFTITEITYFSENDSSIIQRKYDNVKLNSEVDNTWLNFTIPEDAEVVNTEDVIKDSK